jgi:hypothetical protein
MGAPIITAQDTFDREREQSGEVVPSSGLVMRTAFEESLLATPESSLGRMYQMDDAGGDPITSDMFSKNYAQYGLKYSTGMTSGQADIMLERKKRELRNQRIMESAEGGVMEGVGSFGASFAGQLVSPVNILSSFIPVVGEARFANWAARYGMFSSRVMRGVAEGAVGQAVVEPFTLAAKTQEQADYDAVDSLYAIGMGTAMGAALHGTFGYYSDVKDLLDVHDFNVKARALDMPGAALDSVESVQESLLPVYREHLRNLDLNRVSDFYDKQMLNFMLTQSDELNTDMVSIRTAASQVLDGQSVDVSPVRMLGDAERVNNMFDEPVQSFKFVEGESSMSFPELHNVLYNKALPEVIIDDSGKGSSRFRARFKNETGPMKDVPGIGKTADEARSRLVDNYSIRFEKQKSFIDVPPEHTQLMIELETLVRERNMMIKSRDFLMGERFPRDVEPMARLGELDAMVKRFEEMKKFHEEAGNIIEAERFRQAIKNAQEAMSEVRKARDFRELIPKIEVKEKQIAAVRRRIEKQAGTQVSKVVSKARSLDNEISPMPMEIRDPLTPRPEPKAPLDKEPSAGSTKAGEPTLPRSDELVSIESSLSQIKEALAAMKLDPDGELEDVLARIKAETKELEAQSDGLNSAIGCIMENV